MDFGAESFWTAIAALVVQIISDFPRDKSRRTAEQERALVALSEAYHSTHAYYAYLDKHKRSVMREMEIASNWHKAGVLLRKYDANLSSRLDLKSRYWREGATWSAEAIKDAKIGLSDIWREVNVRLT